MCAGWRRWAAEADRPIAALRVTSVLGVAGVLGLAAVLGVADSAGAAAGASGVTAARTAVRPHGPVTKSAGQLSTALAALAGLRTQGEVLTERYDHEIALEQQDAAAYRVAETRRAAARKREQQAVTLLGQQAAADYESNGGPSMAEVVFAGLTDPQGYLGALGLEQALDNQRVDLLAASKSDAIVTRLFSAQAAGLLRQQRAAAQTAGFLRAAVIAAVSRQTSVVAAAQARVAGAGGSPVPAGLPASVLAGGPGGAAPGVVAPDWAPGAGASAAQGNAAANWALTQLGKPYRWGADGPESYDCSGLALQAWARAGVKLLHWTGFQWVSGPHVPLARLRRGDLVFFATNIADPATIHHVGIYIGHGLMVDAPYTGAFVEIDSIYAVGGLIGATRPAA